MVVGSLMDIKGVSELPSERMEALTDVALDEIRTNPVIDQEIRSNRVIMRELAAAVETALREKGLTGGRK